MYYAQQPFRLPPIPYHSHYTVELNLAHILIPYPEHNLFVLLL